MKVLHVVGNFPLSAYGGIETVVVRLTEELARLGTLNSVIGAHSSDRIVQGPGGRYLAVRTGTVGNWIRIPTVRAFRTLRDEIRQSDLVHVHNPPELFNQIAVGLARRARRPIVLSLLTPGHLAHHPRRLSRWTGVMVELIENEELRMASAVQVKNAIDQEQMRARGVRSFLIPDGVADAILTAPREPSQRTPPPSGQAGPVLVFIGRLHPLKGPEDLIRSVPSLLRRLPALDVQVAGPDFDGMANRLRHIADDLGVADHVHVLGTVDESRKLALLNAADVVVIPSRADFVEGFSIIASEAWARGKPVAAYPVGALRARVREGRNGSLARSITVAELAQAIERALAIPSVEVPADVVGWDEVARRIQEVYASVLGEDSRGGASAQ